ncbi:MAG: AraC family transcriptional regulator [Phycisphaerae bacterium]|nr:AraC family transcriptional regulator [Phycisphaerae bacterium]
MVRNKFNHLEISVLRGGRAEYPAGASLGPRRMVDYELVWIMRGNVRYQHNSSLFEAPPGSIILSRPGVQERYIWDAQGITNHAFFHFELKNIPDAFGRPASWPVLKAMPDGDIIRPLFEMLAMALESSQIPSVTWIKLAETIVAAFIAGPVQCQPAAMVALPHPVRLAMEWAKQALAADGRQRIRLEDMARAALVDPKHLCRLFRKAGCQGPMHTVLELRLHRAKNLLERTDFKLACIADICGFANAYHFSRRFTDHFGMSPRAARYRGVKRG